MARHRACCNFYLKDKAKQPAMTSFILFDEYGVENCKKELIEQYECNNKEELLKREGNHIKENECVNRCLAGRTRIEHAKMYREQHPDKVKETRRVCYWNNPEKAKEKSKQWNEQNKDKKRQTGIEYREKNKDILRGKARLKYEDSKEHIKERRKINGSKIVVCECGVSTRKDSISKHKKTKQHQQYLQSIS